MYVLLVATWLALTLTGIIYLMTRTGLGLRQKVLFAGAALASVIAKMILAAQGNNFDVDSYQIVASLVLRGDNVYAHTTRYNYAPLWACFLGGLKHLCLLLPMTGQNSFHVAIAVLLAATDVAVAAVLVTVYSFGSGLFFLCSPVILLLTGFHSQFDNLALLAGLLSWVLIRQGSPSITKLIGSAGLLGLSLVLKHILFLFPIWLFFWPALGGLLRRCVYGAIAYGVFALSFLPWATDAASRAGILQNVLFYSSSSMWSAVRLLVLGHPFRSLPPTESAVLTASWVAVLAAAGILVGHTNGELFPMYLLAMFALSPALADQYLTIPLLASAILYRAWPAWALTGASAAALLSSPKQVLLQKLVGPAARYNVVYVTFMPATQICALVLFAAQLSLSGKSRQAPVPPRSSVIRATSLTLGSAALALVLLMVRP